MVIYFNTEIFSRSAFIDVHSFRFGKVPKIGNLLIESIIEFL